MAEVPLSGRLEEVSFAEVTGALSRGKKTGTLTVSTGDRSRDVVFYEGNPVAVLSENPADHIARFLLAKEKITKEQATELQGLPETKDSLQSKEYLTKDALAWGVKFRFVNLAYDLFRWAGGEYTFVEGPPPKDYFLMKLPAVTLIMKGVRHMSKDTLHSRLPEDCRITPGPLAAAEAGALGDEESALLAVCQEGSTIGELLREGGLDADRAREVLFSFHALGLIDTAHAAPDAELETKPPEKFGEPETAPDLGAEPPGGLGPEAEVPPAPEPPPAEEAGFEIERHSYEEEAPPAPAAGGPAPLFGEEHEKASPPAEAEAEGEGAAGGLAPLGFAEGEVPPPVSPGEEEGPPSLEIPPLSPDLPPPPWQEGDAQAGPGGDQDSMEERSSPFSPPVEEALPKPIEKMLRAKESKPEPAQPRRAVTARLIVLVALAGAAVVVAAGLLTGAKFFRSTTTPLPPIPPAEEAVKPEMAEGIPVPALPKAAAPKARNGKEGAPAEPTGTVPPQAPVTKAAPPAPPPEPQPVGGSYERGLEFYGKGDLDRAASVWKTYLEESGAAYTISVVAACQPSTVQAAFERYGAGRGLFVLPLQLSGRSCYRVVLGTYPDESAAASALQALPSHLRQDLEVRAAKGL